MAKQKQRTRVKLTDTNVLEAKAGQAVVRIWDLTVPGFHLRVTPAGSKSFCVSFQRKDGKKVNVTIGDANSWKVKAAREKASTLRELHDQGRDARAFVQEERTAKTVQELADLWKTDYRDALKPSSRVVYDSLLKVVIIPAIGKRFVKDLAYQDVAVMHRKVAKTHKTSANRSITVLSRLLSIAEKEGWRPPGSNPCAQLDRPSEKPRSRVLSADEYAALEAAMGVLVEARKLDPQVADLVRFLALSGLRKSEAANLKFADVNLERNTMTFEDHKTVEQAGTKVLPLNSHLRTIIQRRAGQKMGAYVFPGVRLGKADKDGKKKLGPIVGLAKMWARILNQAKLADVTPHDLRRTFMSTSMELGYPAAIGDTLLGHSLGKIRDTYVNLGSEGIMATASQDTADWLAAAMAGEEVQVGVKMVKKAKAGAAS